MGAEKSRGPAGFVYIVLLAAMHSMGSLLCEDAALLDRDMSPCPQWRVASRCCLAFFMIAAAGLRRDTRMVERLLVPIVPPPLPPRLCVYASGVAEALAGICLLLPGWEGRAANFICLLLIGVFPANVYHALSKKAQRETRIGPPAVYLRLPIQALFFVWARWHTLG